MQEHTNKEETLRIEYTHKVDKEHFFGFVKLSHFSEITKIEAYVPAIDDWVDVSHMNEFQKPADKLMSQAIEEES